MKGSPGQECVPIEIGADGSVIKGFEQASEVNDQWYALADRLAAMWNGWVGDVETIYNTLLLNMLCISISQDSPEKKQPMGKRKGEGKEGGGQGGRGAGREEGRGERKRYSFTMRNGFAQLWRLRRWYNLALC